MVTLSVFMQLWQAFQIIMKKFGLNSGPNFGGCVSYLSVTYTRINTVCF